MSSSGGIVFCPKLKSMIQGLMQVNINGLSMIDMQTGRNDEQHAILKISWCL